MAKKLKSFVVGATLNVQCNMVIEAETLQDACAKARELHVTDFVNIKGDYIYGSGNIDTVYYNNHEESEEEIH